MLGAGEADKCAAGSGSAIGNDNVDMWMEVDQLAEGLDPGNQDSSFLMAALAETMLLARKGDEYFVMVVGALNTSKATTQIDTAKKPAGHGANDWTPENIAIGVTLIIATLKLGKVTT